MTCDHKFIDSNRCLKCGWSPKPLSETMRRRSEVDSCAPPERKAMTEPVETPEQFARILHDTPMGVEHFERLITARDAAILAKFDRAATDGKQDIADLQSERQKLVADRDALAEKCRELKEAVQQKRSLCDSYNDTQYELERRIAKLEQAVGELRGRVGELRSIQREQIETAGQSGDPRTESLWAACHATTSLVLGWLSELFPELKESTDAPR